MTHLDAFMAIWSFGLSIFGLHLGVLGYLVMKSGYVPKALGLLLLIAGLCYVGTSSAQLLLPSYGDYKTTVDMILGAPMALGELGLAVWLVIRGGKRA